MYNFLICRYHEIAIKGNNRDRFEKCLAENILDKIREVPEARVRRVRGRIWIEKPNREDFTPAETAVFKEVLPRVFGIENFSPAAAVRSEITAIEDAVRRTLPEAFQAFAGRSEKVSFRIRARRSEKNFPLRSTEIEERLSRVVSDYVGEEHLRVDLNHAEFSVYCEVRKEFSFVFYESCKAPGGLPVGSNGGVLALLSGGIDSPVACYLAMKRGCSVDYLAFHSPPYTPFETRDKIEKVAAYMNRYQKFGRLFLANLAPFQKAVRDNCQEKYRTVLYRRAMFRIAEKVAQSHYRKALLTGESIGQVASQTLENMSTIGAAISMMVLRPMLGFDKSDSIALAQKIGSYELSIVPVPDSCTVFSPSGPATASTVEKLVEEEEKIPDYQGILDRAVADVELADLTRFGGNPFARE
ncbi:MAG: tRNA 4-thiouridine(8) synthase ThiI [Victivallaceae bacterium]|nr:tRNA 4-thiouridine(8) synthase ThiI [Victivallaceae bacterium]